VILAACSASFPDCGGLARLPYMGTPVRGLGGTLAQQFEVAKYPSQDGNRCSSSDGVAGGFDGEGPPGRGGPAARMRAVVSGCRVVRPPALVTGKIPAMGEIRGTMVHPMFPIARKLPVK
jgi:hypothetical protein